MREIERRAWEEFGISSEALMENAGRETALLAIREFNPASVTVVCGKGNNGGDGRVAARWLSGQGVSVKVIEAHKAEAPGLKPFDSCDLIIDALFGTGLNRQVDEPYRSLVLAMNNSRKPVLSIDLPSGLQSDTGAVMGCCVRADLTAALGVLKTGHLVHHGPPQSGRVVVLDIGLPPTLLS